ncbi:MAG TPA: hypothetical protein VI033_08885 [Candidatus Nitrosopolaris sp.]
MSAFDWNEIAQAMKIVKTSDQTLCGNVVAEYKDNIIIIAHGPKLHEYMVPKSKVDRYDGSDVYLNIPYSLLSSFDF